ncbi:SusC/RagA family TonB-linked outer membrane protein [Christiangramia sp.]|uniref:SusC/RagA family TonB-linked outer membrane protein n=1 Tax=Christiangramia sp. TaxID=1931228 RepID=UPI0026099D35|nr:SusC/RagA family TonB-linked outer membrane protein [Christiangramia sp.]
MKNFYKRGMLIIMFLLAMAFLVLLAMSEAKAATSAFNSPITLQQEITGTVTGPNNQPLLGVTVRVKNKNYGTTTNLEGNYTISASNGDVLVFSFIGYKPREIPITNQSQINISLEEDVASLDEVQINAGYYTVTQRERTGNISRVTSEEIEFQPVVSPIQALQGRVAGLQVTPGGSHPGMANTIQIRGQNSLRAEGNFPLYIIDGVPINSTPVESNSLLGNAGIDPLNNLSLSNIESIEILKDADATAIYGSRGANGVILITTKSGKNIGPGLEANVYTGVATVPNRLELLTTPGYLQIRRRAFENDEVEPTERNAYDLLVWDQDRYTDWQEFVFGGTSRTTNTSLNYSGGDENTTFRLGGSYFTQGTVYPGDYDYKKMTGNLNINHYSPDQKLNINLSLNYGIDVNNLVGNLNLNAATYLLPPNAPGIFNGDGTLNWADWGAAGIDNPFKGYYNSSDTRTKNLISNLGISYEILEGFRLKTSLGYTNYSSEELWKLPARSYNPANPVENNSFHLRSNRNSWIAEPQLIYDSSFSKLNLQAIVGATFQENTSDRQQFQGSGYASEALIGNIAAAESILNPSNASTDYRYNALFSRIGLNWDQKYYLNLTGRRDGSSRFGPNNRFANFGAVGTAWIFSEEAFIKNSLSFISFGKLRGSFGTTGNDQIGDYGYLDAYEATRGTGGLYPTALANPDYSWEVNKKLEGGLELGLFKNRFNLGLSWYRNRSSNQLVGYTLPAITGFGSVQANLPATVENSGWEIEASANIVNSEKFRWQTTFNISIPENELISYPGIEQSSYANVYRVGYPLNISLNYEYDGLDTETGFYRVNDINNDGRFDFEDRVVIQDRSRKFFGGINNNLSYGGFSLQFLWQFVKQQGSHSLFNTGRPSNQLDVVLETLEPGSKYQRISQSFQSSNAFNNVINTSFPLEDASFLRLKTLSLGYSIPKNLVKDLAMKNFRLYLHGQNLFTITPYDGLDPEYPYSGTAFAALRIITGGLQINL